MRTSAPPSSRLLLSLTLLCAALPAVGGGCGGGRKKGPVASPPPAPNAATPQQVEAIRAAYLRAHPGSQIGVVVAARAADSLVAVGDTVVPELGENQVVTFVDANQKVLTTGTIVRRLPEVGNVHVRYDRPTGTGREPRTGDIMIRF